MSEHLTYPRQTARSLRFSLGAPRNFAISATGLRVLYVRSDGPFDRVGRLRSLDVASGVDSLVADPAQILQVDEELSTEERARRERMREAAGGIISFNSDHGQTRAVFALAGKVFVTDISTGSTEEWTSQSPVIDPRLSPDGKYVAYSSVSGEFRLTDGRSDTALLSPENPDVFYGRAEFVASEEMGRFRGFWWAPDSKSMIVARVDEAPVDVWHIADPAHPEVSPRAIRYPGVGTPNADVRLYLVDLEGNAKEIEWNHKDFEYLIEVSWNSNGPALIHVMSRDQRAALILSVDAKTLQTTIIAEQSDAHWVEVVPGTPQWAPGGLLIMTKDDLESNTRHLTVNGNVVTPAGLQVSQVLDIDRFGITFLATSDATQSHVWWHGFGGELEQLSSGNGYYTGRASNHTLVLVERSLDHYGAHVTVVREGQEIQIESLATAPIVDAQPELLILTNRTLRAALLLPTGYQESDGPLPLLLDPYGGPHHQEVVQAKNIYAEPQWFADQGFAVLIVDNRGTPQRGPIFEKAVSGDLATVPLEDQVDAIEDLISKRPNLIDRKRIAIRGWSFGGYLAALAVLRRPDIFAAGIAGAPVTDFRLYDTFYTERYLGTTGENPQYDANSLILQADRLDRPLMIVHGLADDNVVVAHSLQFSAALLAAGKPHEFLPLSGATHMATQEEIAENLLLLQVEFLNRHLT
ncbi:MAG TPA: prolyl oligopeptidase family serine peptidase [Candidatus Nanopelagicaceae bacterium]|nr:prolyl oligopeptidase family serine peptidase [Candidatus Nanopelagicaceae bacterium]